MDKATIEAMAERIERLEMRCRNLEHRARRWRRIGASTLLAAGLATFLGARRDDVPKVVEAEQFLVVDPDGNVRASIGLTEGVNGMGFYATDGTLRFSVVADDEVCNATLLDREGRNRIRLFADGAGAPMMGLLNDDGQYQAVLQVQPDGAAQLSVHDKEGKCRNTFGVVAEGSPFHSSLDKDGKERLLLSLKPDGAGALDFLDGNSQSRMFMGLAPDSSPSIHLTDDRDVSRLSVQTNPDGSTGLFMLDWLGRPRAGLQLTPEGFPQFMLSDGDGRSLFQAP